MDLTLPGFFGNFITITGLTLEEAKKHLKRFDPNGALLLGQNRVLVLLINFFPFPFLYQNDDKIS